MSKYIGIWYSWGDTECPVKIPQNVNEFSYMMQIALEEVRVSVVESEDTVTIWIKEDYDGNEIVVLNYHSDGEFCYYQIFDSEEECQDFLDEYEAGKN